VPEAELLTTTTAFAALEFQAEIVPSNESKMNGAAELWGSAKSVVDELNSRARGIDSSEFSCKRRGLHKRSSTARQISLSGKLPTSTRYRPQEK
jgi:hypothetical protein